ncbi:MAG: hypothetical protein COX29_03560 [Candidatus Moranbacteria bacterium CG23_combo_of_CG06-09_8_20_14_all_35_22]|nr:MAG: hypothetical protein COX29_03560 [Candidatus Moranbacteria bacterium CG23_combo_of_CG06-09_8_20_14_all_35_22]
MSENAINYLNSNKDKYSKEVLINELIKFGYEKKDIEQSVNFVYGGNWQNANNNSSLKNNFWDFKSKKNYATSSEKWKDFLFGFFAPWLGIFVGFIPLVGLIFLGFEIFAVGYLFNRRRFISYGIIGNFLFGIFVAMAVVLFLIGSSMFF